MLRLGMIAFALAIAAGCAPRVRPTGSAPSPEEMAQLWIDPGASPRDLRAGPAGVARVPPPQPDGRYDILDRDTRGFSITFVVRDAAGREWNVKIGPEAQTEVVSARIAWALGYHQLPSYFVERGIGVQHARGAQFGGARFRPRVRRLRSLGTWSWQRNPFVGSRPYNGLVEAGNFDPPTATRYIARIRRKIDEGLRLP